MAAHNEPMKPLLLNGIYILLRQRLIAKTLWAIALIQQAGEKQKTSNRSRNKQSRSFTKLTKWT